MKFILMTRFVGLFMGYIESYLFWFLEEIGGTKSLMGLTVTVACLAGVPILLLSDKIFRKIGQPNVQVIGFIVYTIRLLGRSLFLCLYLFQFRFNNGNYFKVILTSKSRTCA